MRLKIQTPPSANPVPHCTENVCACLLLLGSTIAVTRDPRWSMQSLCRQWCAGRAAGGESSRCLWSFLYVSVGIWCCTCCRFAFWLHSAGSDLLSLGFPHALSIHSQDPDKLLCQGLLCDAAGESFVPSSGFQIPLNVKFQNFLLDQLNTLPTLPPPSQINKVYLTWKRNNNFLLNYERCAVQNT